jgi:hypothetical protein
MIALLNPTGKPIRSDAAGDGHYGARRGDRRHAGTDYLCDPGQDVVSPMKGFIVRIAYPYADDLGWKGIVIQSDWCRLRIYYLTPFVGIGKEVYRGQPVGTAQDVRQRYPKLIAMQPHVHLEIDSIEKNPEFFI